MVAIWAKEDENKKKEEVKETLKEEKKGEEGFQREVDGIPKEEKPLYAENERSHHYEPERDEKPSIHDKDHKS